MKTPIAFLSGILATLALQSLRPVSPAPASALVESPAPVVVLVEMQPAPRSPLFEMADEDDIAAADARLSEFLRGVRSDVAEDDLAIGTPALVDAVNTRLD